MKIGAILFLLGAVWALHADDAAANQYMKTGFERMEAGSYASAADSFKAAELLADTPGLKAGALTEAIAAYAKAEMHYQEYEAIEKMLDSYPTHADYPALVAREYAIADAFNEGYREPAFAALSWIPWLKGDDKSPEIYQQALKRAPYAEQAPEAKLRTAIHYLTKFRKLEERNKALDLLRGVVKEYPNTPECYFAYVELANALFQLSLRGDGDGAYNREAIAVMEEFLRKYPEAPERDFLKEMLDRSKDIQAERMLGTARFYVRMERPRPAERYLSEILKQHPESASARDAEELLATLDRTFVPDQMIPMDTPERLQEFHSFAMPQMEESLLVAPENSDGRWLLPIYDLKLPKRAETDGNK